ncbi:MAG: M48 family metallopeptidase [Xenococcaceae cyanobacterium MO_188.B32]|nr:M48 family metallopeptidase [Xenococcaceae cyanobacterium MO_188.B32]
MFKFFSWRFRKSWFYTLISIFSAAIVCLTNIQPSYSISWFDLIRQGVQVIQLSNISNKQEIALGKQINEQLIKSGQAKIYRDRQITNYINQIGQKLAKNSERPDIPYTFQVVNDKSINAFATMGGYVYVNTGLMLAAENEAELASVIGHEIGHIVGRHAIEHMRQRAISQGILSVAGLDQSAAVQIGVDLAVNRPNSREDELEADRLGLANLKKAGYAPSGMVSFMKKLLKQGSSGPKILSTHPSTSDRIQALNSKIEPSKANVGAGLNSQAYKRNISSLR